VWKQGGQLRNCSCNLQSRPNLDLGISNSNGEGNFITSMLGDLDNKCIEPWHFRIRRKTK
jgi:hypothetical protein